jgi:hypothetical protein
MNAYRLHIRIWALWILVVPALSMINPWGELGWIELAAALCPLFMLVESRIKREAALAVGLPALTLMWLFDSATTPLPRMLVGWVVFTIGVILAARTTRSQSELEEIAGRVAFAPHDPESVAKFHVALEREFGRGRRHDRPFAVLSAAAHPHSLDGDASGLFRSELLRSLAENRARLELEDFLRAELHVYSDVAIVGPRVLALVPEVDDDALAILVERVRNSAEKTIDFDVQIGAGCFPRDAICAEDLIEVADRNRTTSKLRSLPDRIAGRESDLDDWRLPDVQG